MKIALQEQECKSKAWATWLSVEEQHSLLSTISFVNEESAPGVDELLRHTFQAQKVFWEMFNIVQYGQQKLIQCHMLSGNFFI